MARPNEYHKHTADIRTPPYSYDGGTGPQSLVFQVLVGRLSYCKRRDCYILDGFPATFKMAYQAANAKRKELDLPPLPPIGRW